MQCQYKRKFFNPHAFLSFLIAAAVVTFELIIITECLCVTKTLQTMRNTRVLIDVNLEFENKYMDSGNNERSLFCILNYYLLLFCLASNANKG